VGNGGLKSSVRHRASTLNGERARARKAPAYPICAVLLFLL
jgi:hypothetical protein